MTLFKFGVVFFLSVCFVSSQAVAGLVVGSMPLTPANFSGVTGTFTSNSVGPYTDPVTGVSFDIQFTAAAPAGFSLSVPSSSNRLGIDDLNSAADDADEFDSNSESVVFSNISIVNFMANGSGLSLADLTVDGFTGMTFVAAGASSDSGRIIDNSTSNSTVWSDVATSDFITAPNGPASSITIAHLGGSWRANSVSFQVNVSAVPEPTSVTLFASSIGLVLLRRKRR